MRQQNIALQSHKADLLLINEIAKPSQISQLQAPSNLTELHNLLKFKNTKSSRSRQEKQNAQNWLNKEGIDISPLVQRVKKAKQINIQKEELKKIQEDCLFYIPDMSYKKIDEYLVKAHDYGTLNIIQKNMKKDKFTKKLINKIQNKFLESRGESRELLPQKSLGIITSIRTQTRDDQKRQKYLKCITALAKKNIQKDELVHHISNTTNKKFWKILAKHIKCLNEAKSVTNQERMTELFLESLKIVEDEYDSTLARGTQSLSYYLTSNYLEKLDKREEKYLRDREHSAFWGKAFILYRAGRKKDFYNLLATRNETQLLQSFIAVDQSIDQKAPITKNANHRSLNTDVFRDQLVYALEGEGKYSSDVLSDPTTLDFIWILLRNIAIFYSASGKQFENYKTKVLQEYKKKSFLTQQQLYNYFYLLAYDEIAQMGLTDIMDQDDYVHFLICLNENPALLGNKSSKVQKLLTTQLMLYIRELISLSRSEYVYYMSLIPKEDRITEISTMLSASNLVSTFNWEYLRSCIPTKQEFEQLVKRTLQKYILTTNDYLSAAEKYIELLNYSEESVRCLLQFLINNFYRNSYADENVLQAETACDRYLHRNPQLDAQFKIVYKFLVECRKLLELIKERKDGQIYNLVKKDEFILLSSTIPQKHHQFFNTLISLSGIGLDIYFKFIRNVIKGLEIYYSRQNNNAELNQFVTLIEENMDFIFSFDQYKAFANREEVNSLRQMINSTHYEVTSSKR